MRTQFEAVSKSPTLQKSLQTLHASHHVRQALHVAKVAAGGHNTGIYDVDSWNWVGLPADWSGEKVVSMICALHGVTPQEAGFGR